MFFRLKKSGERAYVQIVENKRIDGAVRQSVVATLGRADELEASGALASLLASGAKLTDQVMLITALDQDEGGAVSASAKRLGGPLLFGKIWERLGVPEVLSDLLADRAFEFSVERAVFVSTLHRLFVSGSDRDGASWMQDYDIAGAAGLDLHHFYRAMAWLGEEMEEKADDARAPRCVKDAIEERLFEKRRDLFCDLSAVFMDTTSLSFYGEGGETLGERGYSKDYRPDLNQMILALIVDGKGRPICTEMWPGNTADVTTLLPVVDRLRRRFSIGRVCVVADRGMISAATIEGLEARGLDYILGARERSDAIVRKMVLESDTAAFTPLYIEREAGETQLFVKEVKVDGKRYVVCRNEAEAEKDRKDREKIVGALDAQLKKGDKALVGNSAYRRYLRRTPGSKDKHAFEIDAGKLAEEARFDGVFVLRTNAKVTPLQAVLRYRDLLQVEELFRRTKADHAHAADLPLLGRRHPRPCVLLLPRAGDAKASRGPHARGEDRARVEGAAARSRPPAANPHPTSWRRLAGAHRRRAFGDCAVSRSPCRLPPRARQTAPPKPQAPPALAKKRRGRPKRGATPPQISPQIA